MNADEIADRTHALSEAFRDRVPVDVRRHMDEDLFSGEYGILISELVATLANKAIPVTSAERAELGALAEATGEGTEFLARLVVTGE